MKHLMRDIANLHRAFGHPIRRVPLPPDDINDAVDDDDLELYDKQKLQQRMMMRLRLIYEKFFELLAGATGNSQQHLLEAAKENIDTVLDHWRDSYDYNAIETADALTDLMVVIVGMALEMGIPLDRTWAEVHRSNMAKVGPDGKVTYRKDGKVLKPEGWTPPDIKAALYGPEHAQKPPLNAPEPTRVDGATELKKRLLRDSIVLKAVRITRMIATGASYREVETERMNIRLLCDALEGLPGLLVETDGEAEVDTPYDLELKLKQSAMLDTAPKGSLERAAAALGVDLSDTSHLDYSKPYKKLEVKVLLDDEVMQTMRLADANVISDERGEVVILGKFTSANLEVLGEDEE